MQHEHRPGAATAGLTATVIVLAAMGIAGTAQAASFEAVPTIKMGGTYESNPRLENDDEDDAAGVILEGRLDVEWATESTSFEVKPRGRFSFYADGDDDDLEDEDLYLDSRLSHRTVLSEYGLEAGISTVGVRTSELESAGGDSGSGSGTLRRADDSRETLYIRPDWSRQFGTLNRISASAGYTDVDFDKSTSQTSRLPYEYWNGQISFERTLTQKTGAGILVDGSRFESNPTSGSAENETTTVGASLFVNHAFTETISGSAYGGWRTSDIEIDRQPFGTLPGGGPLCLGAGLVVLPCTEKFSDDNFVGELALRKEAEITNFDLRVSRFIRPNSNGTEQVRDTIDAVVSRRLTERLTGRIGVLYFTQEDVGDTTSREDDYISARFSLNWLLTERWRLESFYRYVKDEDEGLAGFREDATNHYVYLGVTYQGVGWRR